VLISEGDTFLIMHLWELYPGLGGQLSNTVRRFRQHGVTPDMLEDMSSDAFVDWGMSPRLVAIVRTEVQFMREITAQIEQEVSRQRLQHTSVESGGHA
jgi:hypothetical protein